MKRSKIKDFIASLNVSLPPDKEFLRISRDTPVIQDLKDEHFLNYERGILLYSLIAKYKPKNILEMGTANGYSTLCMAWAMVDHNIDGTIYTIDPIKPDQVYWMKKFPQSWLDRIKILTGYTGEVMNKTIFPRLDMAFIDGAHFYEAVKHDFYSFLNNANDTFNILFDDYVSEEKNHVKKALDEVVLPYFNAIIIETNIQQQLKEIGKSTDKEFTMCWINSNNIKKPFKDAYPKQEIEVFLKKYRNFEKRLIFRNKVNQKVPFLKNVRFRFWR